MSRFILWIFLPLLFIVSILLMTLAASWKEDTAILFLQVSYKDVSLILSSLGTSLFAALTIYISLQILSEKLVEKKTIEIINAVKEDLFRAIYGRYISPSLFFEVERCLLKSDFIRKNTNLLLELNEQSPQSFDNPEGVQIDEELFQLAKDKGYLFCLHSISYDLVNTSSSKAIAPIKSVIELPLDLELAPIVRTLGISVNGKLVNKDKIQVFNDIKRDACVTLHSEEVEPEEKLQVKVESLLLKKETDVETWASVFPTETLNITIVHGSSYDANASANHADSLIEAQNTASMKQWVLDKGIFPYQSVVVWWHRIH